MAAKTKNKEEEKEENIGPEDLLDSYLKNTKEDHLNFEEEVNYKVSSGSLILDIEIGGGFGPGAHRFSGFTESGKSSAILQIMKNFLTIPNARGVYVKTEGRLSKEMQKRSGVSFTFDAKDWKNGVCFVFECNVYETVFGLLRQLMTNNPDKIKYFFVIDSSDGLILRDDLNKPLEEAGKVAGGALITSVFMKKVANAMAKRGHMFFTTGQVRSEIKLDPYAKVQPRLTSSTGGNAILHYSNFILEFEPHLYSKDVILENPKEKPDRVNNRPLGHWCKVEIKKSTNESSGIKVAYPIRYGRTNGTSIWREYELMDLLVAWKFVTQKGSWIEINFPENIKEEMQKRNIECEPKVQGQQKLLKMLEDNGPLCDLLCEKFKEILMEK